MTSQNPDPLEDHITGLEPGGGVPPGETPPGEGSTGGPQGHDEGGPPRGTQVAVLVALGIVVLFCLLFFVGYIVGLL